MASSPNHPADGPRDESFAVNVEAITFRSDDGRFAVARAVRHQDQAPVTLVGRLGATSAGEELRVRGNFETHPVHGLRFQVRSYLPILPTTKEGLARFLGSGLVPGIGPSTAKRIVDKFGERTLDIISTQRAKLLEVNGVGRKRAEQLAEVVKERRLEAEQLAFLRSVGLGPAISRRVLKRYQENATHQLKEDPYLVAEQVEGVGFATADEIGQALGIPLDDPRRVAGAVLHLLGKAADAGHVLLPRGELSEHVSGLQIDPGLVPTSLDELAAKKLVVMDGDDVYAPPLHRAELRLAAGLRKLNQPSATPDDDIDAALTHATEVTAQQKEAVAASLRGRLTLLTGGPGTGKTTTIRAIVAAHPFVVASGCAVRSHGSSSQTDDGSDPGPPPKPSIDCWNGCRTQKIPNPGFNAGPTVPSRLISSSSTRPPCSTCDWPINSSALWPRTPALSWSATSPSCPRSVRDTCCRDSPEQHWNAHSPPGDLPTSASKRHCPKRSRDSPGTNADAFGGWRPPGSR